MCWFVVCSRASSSTGWFVYCRVLGSTHSFYCRFACMYPLLLSLSSVLCRLDVYCRVALGFANWFVIVGCSERRFLEAVLSLLGYVHCARCKVIGISTAQQEVTCVPTAHHPPYSSVSLLLPHVQCSLLTPGSCIGLGFGLAKSASRVICCQCRKQ